MSILTVRHVTTYSYRQPVSFSEHRMMFRPRDSYDQRLLDSALVIAPEPVSIRWVHDVFGNCVAFARFAGRAKELRFESTIRLEHTPSQAPDFQMEEYAESYPFTYGSEDMPDLLRSIERHAPDPQRDVNRWARQFLRRDGTTNTGTLLAAMTHAIRQNFTYVAREEKGTQDPAQTLRLGSGSCRDFALLMMEAVRSLGLAARFVSGYLYSPSRDASSTGGGARRVGGGATHAWLQVYLPGAGWVEFDPTNGIVGNRDLIRVAVVRDPKQAVPLSGSWTGFPADYLGMTVEVAVSAADDREDAPDAGRGRGAAHIP
jgi:transglutaminase-like putative cysteine protease